ncbi:MAG TPA: YfcC family protein [Lachnospiraceae bacterium]|nr:YfcC family protein [Lachnospiraceae bacterium]
MKKRFFKNLLKFDNSFVFIFTFIILAMVLTYVVPAGQYDRVTDDAGTETVLENSFHAVEQHPVNPARMFVCIAQGFINTADVIFCILMAYCFMGFLVRYGVFDGLIKVLIRKMRNKAFLLLPAVMIFFGLLGSVAGLAEETFGMFPICIALAVAIGYDEIVGGAIVYLAVFTGFASATFNPYTIGVAQTIAGLPLYSGLWLRVVCWVVFMGILIAYVMRYAAKIKKDPTKSYLYSPEKKSAVIGENSNDVPMTIRQKLCLALFGAVFAAIICGSLFFKWYIMEITALFIAAGVLAGIILGLSANDIANSFVELGSETMFSMLVIGLSNAVCVVLNEGYVADSIVHGMASLLNGTTGYLTASVMLVIQNLLNFFIPSGPGQAAVSMPIMSSLADATGISRQLAVLAFQFGDGYSNIFWPTMVCMMCGIMKIPVTKWYRFVFPLFGIMFAVQLAIILFAAGIGY